MASSWPSSPLNMEPMCAAGDFFGRPKLLYLTERAYEPVNPLEIDPNELWSPAVPNLALAAAYIRHFLEDRKLYVWYHVKIRCVAMSSFLDAIDGDRLYTKTLPFSCWCDAGEEGDGAYPYHRQHRHFIVVTTSESHFIESIWERIVVLTRCYPNDNVNISYKTFRPILSPYHLLKTMGNLSRKTSRCRFSFEYRPSSTIRLATSNHYAIARTLPVDHAVVLTLLWNGGLPFHFHQLYRFVEPANLLKIPFRFSFEGRWSVKIRNIPGLCLDDPNLPLKKGLRVSSQPSQHFLFVKRNQKTFFVMKEDDDPGEEQLQPFTLSSLGEEWWTPFDSMQEYLHHHKQCILDRRVHTLHLEALLERVAQLETLVQSAKEQCLRLVCQNKNLIKDFKDEKKRRKELEKHFTMVDDLVT